MSHYARGGTRATEKLYYLPYEIIPGEGGKAVSYVLRHVEGHDYVDHWVQRDSAGKLRELAKQPQPEGPLAGLIFNRPNQFLEDLADNLDLRADMLELHWAILGGRNLKPTLRRFMGHLRPYVLRTGYKRTFQGPLTDGLTLPLRRLEVPELTAAIDGRSGDPAKGYLINLMDAIDAYARG